MNSPKRSQIPVWVFVTVIGWGVTVFGGGWEHFLLFASMFVVRACGAMQ